MSPPIARRQTSCRAGSNAKDPTGISSPASSPRPPITTSKVVVAPPPMAGAETLAGDLAGQGTAARLVASRPDLIFHLAAVVSGEAETDFRKGYRVNLDGTRELLDAIPLPDPDQPWT